MMTVNLIIHISYNPALVAKTREPEDKQLCIAVHILLEYT